MRCSPLFVAAISTLLFSSCGTDSLFGNQQQTPPPSRGGAISSSFNQETLPPNSPSRALSIPKVAPPQVDAASAIVVDALTGRTIYQKNADTIRQVASTQKLVTALVVAENGNLDKNVNIQACDTAVEPTKIYFKPGDTYTRDQLLHALLIKSGNDAAKALARDVGGSEARFCQMMNNKAARLGMSRSNFLNPHGLTVPGQYSTARDMARAALAVYRNPVIRECISTKFYQFNYSSGRASTLRNTNRLLREIPWCTGMKTGTTNAAGRCLISSGGSDSGHAIVVVLGANSASIWRDSASLLRWATSGS